VCVCVDHYYFVTFDILMAVTLNTTLFWEVTPCAVLVFIARFGQKSRQNYTTAYFVLSHGILFSFSFVNKHK